MFNNTGGGLPYPDSHLVHGFVQLDTNNLPNPPQFATPVPAIDRYGPVMLYALVTNIQANAEQSTLRRLMFNRAAENGYSNQYFERLYKSAMAFLSAKVAQGRINTYGDMSNDVLQTAAEICSTCAAFQVEEFKQLMIGIPPQYHQAVISDVHGYYEISNIVNQHMSNPGQQNNYNQGNQGGREYSASNMFGGNNQQRPVQQFGGAVNNNNSAISQYRSGVDTTAIDPAASAVGSRFNNMDVQQPQAKAVNQHASQVYGGATQNVFNQSSVESNKVEQENQEVTDDGCIIEKASISKYKWRPTDQQRYIPAYAPSKSELYYKINPQTNVVIALTRPMDFDQHNVPNAARVISKSFSDKAPIQTQQLDYRQVNDILEDANEQVSKDSRDHKAIEELTDFGSMKTSVHRDVSLTTFSEQDVWHVAALKRAHNKVIPKLFRTYAVIRSPIVGLVDENEFIESLGNQKTYSDLKNKLIEGSENGISPEVVSTVNRYITKVINNILKMEIGVNTSIDSFVTDYDELIVALRKKYGDIVVNAFADGAFDAIDAAFLSINDNGNSDVIMEGFSFDPENQPKLTFINRIISVTLIDLLAVELDIELSETTPFQLRSSEHPHLYKLARDLFADVRADGYSVESNLVRTKDGVILRLTKGYFGNDSYQLTIVTK